MKKYSLIRFGSQLNSNFDEYSDKDVLVVADTIEQTMNLHNELSNDGWSVSSYTYSKLKYLSSIGSLFISHLKTCSDIVCDYDNKFKEIIESHIENENYRSEINDSRKYFKVLEHIPDLKLGYAWFCDCFFVGLRNYLIFENAEKKIFEFSYLNLIKQLLIEKRINDSQYYLLKQLRVVKHNYRNEILDELPSRIFVDSLIDIACNSLKIMLPPKFVQPHEYQKIDINKVLSNYINGYQRLRIIEGFYCAKGTNIPTIKKIVSNPQFYASRLMNIDFVVKVLDILENNETNNNDNILEVSLIRCMNE